MLDGQLAMRVHEGRGRRGLREDVLEVAVARSRHDLRTLRPGHGQLVHRAGTTAAKLAELLDVVAVLRLSCVDRPHQVPTDPPRLAA